MTWICTGSISGFRKISKKEYEEHLPNETHDPFFQTLHGFAMTIYVQCSVVFELIRASFDYKLVKKESAGPSSEGHQGCGIRVRSLLNQLAVIAIQLAAYAFMSLEGPKTHGSPPSDRGYWICFFIKIYLFLNLFSKPKKSEKRFPRR